VQIRGKDFRFSQQSWNLSPILCKVLAESVLTIKSTVEFRGGTLSRVLRYASAALVILSLAPVAQSCWVDSYNQIVVERRLAGQVLEIKFLADKTMKRSTRVEIPIARATVSVRSLALLSYEAAAIDADERRQHPEKTEATVTVTTDAQGRYQFEDLPIGTHEIMVRAPGYRATSAFLFVSGESSDDDQTVDTQLSAGGGTCSFVYQPKLHNASVSNK
jgi:hypothetical protein